MLDEHEHVYYWAWAADDNEDSDFRKPKWFRVFRVVPKMGTRDVAITEPMTRDEAKVECSRIVKITGGREI